VRYRVFTNDIGPDRFSCFGAVDADSQNDANAKARTMTYKLPGCGYPFKYLALAENRKDLWPDGKTGRLPK
jgi:hypothetical protein